jgi:putative Mn2+ efflux pump MntP
MSTFLSPMILGLTLALDCFAIAICQGLGLPAGVSRRPLVILALLFGVFQAGMLLIGYFTGGTLLNSLGAMADWIAALLLFFIGGKMLKEGFEEGEDEEVSLLRPRDFVLLAIATSIDALAAGVSLVALKTSVWSTAIWVGLTSTGLALLGGFAGKQLGESLGRHAEKVGGLVLIGLGLKILLFK